MVTQNLFSLEHKVAIVTGAGRGIGRGIALAFAKAGADVVVAARTMNQIEETADMARGEGRKALAAPTDVLDISQIEATLQKTVDTFGRVDILVNNAGGLPDDIPPAYESGYVLNVSVEEWKSEIELNLNSLFYCCKVVASPASSCITGETIFASGGMINLLPPGYREYVKREASA